MAAISANDRSADETKAETYKKIDMYNVEKLTLNAL